jgi:5-methylcytosine-specific restriction endonuclease McrA
MVRKTISKKTIDEILLIQNGKCANSPFKPAINLSDYNCLLWKYQNGVFDESGYEIDHIDEYSILSKQDNVDVNHISNLQALCPSCHKVKTKKFRKQKNTFTSSELEYGHAHMEIDEPAKKRKRNN